MRYLRMFTNSALGGLLGAAFITILVLQLNPQLPLAWSIVIPLYARMALFYAVQLAVGFYALLVLWQLSGSTVYSPGWISLRMLSWLGTIVASAGAALMWFNLASFQHALEEDSVRRLAAAAGATTVCAALLAIITIVHYSFGRRGSRVGGTLLVLTLAASLLFPLTARGWGRPRPLVARPIDLGTAELIEAGAAAAPGWEAGAASGVATEGPRVVLLALDGASLDYISLKTAEGRLPNFGRILTSGAAMHLTTIRPTQPSTVWSAVSTGKYPFKNGVRSAAMYAFASARPPIELLPDLCFAHALVHVGILREVELHSSSLRARPIWNILSTQRVPTGIVGWSLTAPADPLRGFLISDRFHLSASPLGLTEEDVGYPAQAVLEARSLQRSGRLADSNSLERPPLARDAQYRDVGALLDAQYRPRLLALRYEGLDRAGHQFLRFAMPRAFGDVSFEERQRYGSVLDEHYAFIDAEVGKAIAALGVDDLLLVVSGFGMEPVSLGKRLLARVLGEPDQTGTHERAPDGFLLAYGRPVRFGRAPLGSVIDVAPTVLYFLGLPVARDMDGNARTDIFKQDFTTARPITFIPTYER
jgi:Type I phosphodiesterase / nucleotide pyrophosphatase